MKNNWLHDHSANIYSQFGEDGKDSYRMNSQTPEQVANEESAFSNMTASQIKDEETND